MSRSGKPKQRGRDPLRDRGSPSGDVTPQGGGTGGARGAEGLVYIATPDNPNYLGPAAPAAIARQVRASVGPSGPNDEYVLRLAEALRAIGARDDHVFAVEHHVRAALG